MLPTRIDNPSSVTYTFPTAVHSYAPKLPELTVFMTEFTPLGKIFAIGIKFLDTVIISIGNIYVACCIHRNA